MKSKISTRRCVRSNGKYRSSTIYYLIVVLIAGMILTTCIKNEYPPEIYDQEFSLNENSPSGTIVGIVEASDLDENSVLKFLILEGNENSTFIIDAFTGLLTIGNPSELDYEKNKEFTLKIQVTDSHSDEAKHSEASIRIILEDINEFAPELEDHFFQIEEFPETDTLIGKIIASDGDLDQNLMYTIESGNEKNAIRIDSLSGELFVADSSQFDLNTNSTITCMISVSDDHHNAPKKTSALLKIEIKEGEISVYTISGKVQKGPFIEGSVISLSELDENMYPTGRNYTTNILDNSGSFQLNNVSLKSKYVQLNANGFYFNERTGKLSEAQLSLYCIADLTKLSTTNINIVSHIEFKRIKYLISNGASFDEAKAQAQREVLSIFDISNEGLVLAEQMDISEAGDDNAILLAVSVILQGHKSTAEFSEFINRISSDIREDGILDNQELGTELINSVNHSNMSLVRDYLESRYNELSLDYTIPEFEKYISQFIENTRFEPTNEIIFPTVGTYGTNSLHPDTLYIKSHHNVTNDRYHSFCAEIPEGRSLKVRVSGERFYIAFNSEINMDYVRDPDNEMATISSVAPGFCDLKVKYVRDYDENPSEHLLFEYFSDGSEDPYFSKHLTITDESNPPPDSTQLK